MEHEKDDAVIVYPFGATLRPVHPGQTLAAEMKARRLSANAPALRLRVPANRLTDIVRGRRGISPETALRLGRCFGDGASFWVNLQANYDLAVAERDLGGAVASEVQVA